MYRIEFNININGPFISAIDPHFSFVGKIVHYDSSTKAELLIKGVTDCMTNNASEEFSEALGSFIRIEAEEVHFGQYVDDYLATKEEFKDYFDEGEKIFGSVPSADFLQVAKLWLSFLIHPDTKERNRQFNEQIRLRDRR